MRLTGIALKRISHLSNICILKLDTSQNYCFIFAEVEEMAAPSLFKEKKEWLFMLGYVCIYFWMLFLYHCMLCAMLSFFKQYFCFVCINRVLFFSKILCETTGICLTLFFQMFSNLAEALYLICMFIIWQQIVQPSPSIALERVATSPLVDKGTAIRMDRISLFRDAVTLQMAAYFVYGI